MSEETPPWKTIQGGPLAGRQVRLLTEAEIAERERQEKRPMPEDDELRVEETRIEWWVLGHPGWPDGIDFRTREKAEAFYWDNPKLDGSREGIRIRRKDVIRFEAYVPEKEKTDG